MKRQSGDRLIILGATIIGAALGITASHYYRPLFAVAWATVGAILGFALGLLFRLTRR